MIIHVILKLRPNAHPMPIFRNTCTGQPSYCEVRNIWQNLRSRAVYVAALLLFAKTSKIEADFFRHRQDLVVSIFIVGRHHCTERAAKI